MWPLSYVIKTEASELSHMLRCIFNTPVEGIFKDA
jgi:hypothetical protein